jgi:hypothetical protein
MSNLFELQFESQLNLSKFSFGVIVNNNKFINHFKSDVESDVEVIDSMAIFQNDRKRLLIQFEVFDQTLSQNNGFETEEDSGHEEDINPKTIEDMFNKYEFVVNYSQIKSIHFKDNSLVIKLIFPPLLYHVIKEENYDFNYDFIDEQSNDNQNDCSDVSDESHESYDNSNDMTIDNNCDEVFDVSEELAHFEESDLIEEFCNDDEYQRLYDENRKDFSGFRIRTTQFNGINEQNFTKINAISFKIKDKTLIEEMIANMKAFDPSIVINEESLKELESKDVLISIPNELPFNVKYSLEALISYSFHFIDSLTFNKISPQEFIQIIKQFCEINSTAVESSLNDLQKSVENGLAINPYFDFIELFISHNVIKSQKWTNSSVMFVRRCILTPTRLLLLPALPLQQSRFLRTCNPDYAIRVLIKDEDFQLLSFSACKTSLPEQHPFVNRMKQFLSRIIVKRLKDGISIGGRIYKLVGASTSQLRDHGLVLYARDDRQREAQQICQEIGLLSGILNAAKFISKIGLSMSQSRGFVPNVNCVEMIDDITGGEHQKTGLPYVFSDGVGMISQQMAQKLMLALNRNYNYIPSAFQIRFAGFKGILVLNPELEGERILMRPSMKKFESNSKDLDILKVSEPRSVYLNRPLITILNQMGVTNGQLLRLQFERLRELSIAFSCNCKAIQLIKSYSSLKIPYNQLLESGIDILCEPFFVQIMESIILKVSADLKNKARILIPSNEGRVMYGVLDETQTLDYGQVFVQYSDEENGTKNILKGDILVTKYPCMHAGDVRKLTAVDVPALHHIVDCIAFPEKGQRPHPDEMAGSDLDGDEYSVIWYKPFVFERQNYEPMHFPCGEALDLERAVNVRDILEFYCKFIENNQVGLIASSHLAWADYSEAGIFSRICNLLDNKYAVALDYAKTGKNERLQNKQKPNRYPDFMMKFNEKPTYQSRRGLGKLYQTSCYFNDVIDNIAQQNTNQYEINEKLIHKNAYIYMNDAEVMFEMYKNAVKDLKEQFGIESESALISGSFTKTHKYLCTQNDNNDIHDLVSNITNKLFNDFFIKFETMAEDNSEMRLAKASAWYQTCVIKNNETDDKYFGFPWIVSKYLAQLALKNSSAKHNCNQYSKKLYQSLDNMFEASLKQIQSLVHNFIFHSYREDIFFGQELNQKFKIKEYLDQVIKEVFIEESKQLNESKVRISTALIKIFTKLSNNFDDLDCDEMKLKVGVIALMANYRLLRIGIIQSSIKLTENEMAFSITITEKLANNIIDNNVENFYSIIKKKTNLKQIKIRFGRKGQDSSISVFGTKSAIEKFRAIIIHRYLCSDIRKGDFFIET